MLIEMGLGKGLKMSVHLTERWEILKSIVIVILIWYAHAPFNMPPM